MDNVDDDVRSTKYFAGQPTSAADRHLQHRQARCGQQVSVLPRMQALPASPPRPPAGYAFSAGARAYHAGAATRAQAASTFGQRMPPRHSNRPRERRVASSACSSSSASSAPRVLYAVSGAGAHDLELHPECAARVPAIERALEGAGLTASAERLETWAAAGDEDVTLVHDARYLAALEKKCAALGEGALETLEPGGPTYAGRDTAQLARRAAGAGMALVDAVEKADRAGVTPPVGFSICRPPGHHAVPAGPMGFCVLSNVAVAARHAQRLGYQRVLIYDYDVHHGNGTQDAFFTDPDVFFCSTHQSGSYPGTGAYGEVGEGSGEGTTLNLPLPGGAGDTAARLAFDTVVAPAVQRFKPDIIMVSAGYDAHWRDKLAGLQFQTSTYHALGGRLKELADELCGGRLVFFLEGGYDLEALGASVADTWRGVLGLESEDRFAASQELYLYDEPIERCQEAITKAVAIHSL